MNYYNDYGPYDYGSSYSGSDFSSAAGAGLGIFLILAWVFAIAIWVVSLISMWKVFKKAGKPGWASIVPYYNFYVMTQIAGVEWWYLLLLLVPFANIYAMYKIYDGIAKNFGKSTGFTFGLIFLPFVFFAILAFNKNIVYMDDGYSYSASINDMPSNDGINTQSTSIEMETNMNTVQSVVPEQNVNNVMSNTVANTNIGMGFNEAVSQQQPVVNQNMNFGFENVSEPTPVAAETVQNVAPTFNEAPVVNEQPVVMQEPTVNTAQPANPFDFGSFNSAPSVNEVQSPVQNVAPSFNEPPVTMQEPVIEQNIQPEPFGFNNSTMNTAPVMNADVNNNVESIIEEVQEVMQDGTSAIPNEQHTSMWSNQNNNSSNNGQF